MTSTPDITDARDQRSSQPADPVDVVVVGTGAAALSAAITAADRGLSVLMVEGSDRWGGSSAMSGGGLWLPNNPVMRREGAGDSREEALEYLQQTVGDDGGRGATRERREAFVDAVDGMVGLFERHGAHFIRDTAYPDYYPELPGGKVGRAIEVVPFDVHELGEWWASSRGQDNVPAPLLADDFWQLQRAWSTVDGFWRGARFMGRVATALARRQKLVGMGAALTGTLMQIALRLGVQVWLDAPLQELVTDAGRVTGVRVQRRGETVMVTTHRGVVLASGGFDHNSEWRERAQGVSGDDSSGSRANQGSPIAAAQAVGAAVDLMDEAWWGASVPSATPGGAASFLVSERSVPHTIIVDADGRRFANESESYVDLGHHMLQHRLADGRTGVEGGFWMVCDARHARRYLRSYATDPRVVKQFRRAGIMHTAATLDDLASSIGIDAGGLRQTVERFNGMVRTGIDHDFGRGNSAYDRYYGDPTRRPNPNLGTLERGPFTAVKVVVGDLGTKGGVVTDVHARALRDDGSVIEGLYAAGNCSAAVMGRTYPGPGSTLGPATVFGHLAALHLAGQPAGTHVSTPQEA